jgi:RNA polymerase sigma factor (sigma-70 family)
MADDLAQPGLEQQFLQARPALVTWFRRRVGDPSEAEDLAQECYLRIAGRAGAQGVAHFEGYLYRTAKSVLFDRRRRRTVRLSDAHVPFLPEHAAIDDTDALRTLLARERLQQVVKVLTAMPERTRSIFILSRLEGLRYAEIAARYAISVGAVQKHMLRAIETLMLAREEDA